MPTVTKLNQFPQTTQRAIYSTSLQTPNSATDCIFCEIFLAKNLNQSVFLSRKGQW